MNQTNNDKIYTGPLWANINVRSPDECWLWKGSTTLHGGYGRLVVNGRIKRAHRMAWEQTYGPIPENMCVCHTCDIPRCCNPNHLFLGTQKDNMRDMQRKGRKHVSLGSECGRANLTEDKVIGIMARLLTGKETQQTVANSLHVPVSAIKDIWNHRSWKHLFR